MKRLLFATGGMALFTLVAFGCGPRFKAPNLANGDKVKLDIVIDRNASDPGLSESQVKQRNQVGDFMENNIVQMAVNAGFEARAINTREGFKPGQDKYLLIVKITDYNPGSKAARMLVGFGAGSASLSTHSDLYATLDNALLSQNHQISSGRDWTFCVRALNEETLKAVAEHLSSPGTK
ncbi:MAG: DUF4410 domain-containing protein [Deltaproteobacteria bacterium]|nr:DUF4410 domain-containing protein [Deltaproteobacteria bacterium]